MIYVLFFIAKENLNPNCHLLISRVTATTTEAFILRLFRQGNSQGFVKAFSDQPEVISAGFATLEKTLKLLYLRKVNLWPRYMDRSHAMCMMVTTFDCLILMYICIFKDSM